MNHNREGIPMRSILVALIACLVVADAGAAVSDFPGPDIAQMHGQFESGLVARVRAWIATADLTPLPVVKLSADPRASERADADAVQQSNATLKDWAALRACLMDPRVRTDQVSTRCSEFEFEDNTNRWATILRLRKQFAH